MTRARNSANLASQGNLFVDIANDRTGIGSVVPAQNLHVAGTAGFHADTTFTGDLYNATWDRSDNSLKFVDNAKIKVGTGGDLEVYHNGTRSEIINNTGDFIIQASANNKLMLRAQTGASHLIGYHAAQVELYHNANKKFETTAYGTNTTGTAVNDGLVVAGVATVTTMNVTGVLTYDDVTSVDSVGIITARQGVRVPNGSATSNYISVGNNGALRFWGTTHQYADIRAGNLHFRNASLQNVLEIQQDKDVFFYGNAYFQATRFDQTVTIADTITHHGDTDTKIRFPAADTITAETGGSERLRIDSNGQVGINTDASFGATNNVKLLVNGDMALRNSAKGDSSVVQIGSYGKAMTMTTSAVDVLRFNAFGNGAVEITVFRRDTTNPQGAQITKLYIAFGGSGNNITSASLVQEDKVTRGSIHNFTYTISENNTYATLTATGNNNGGEAQSLDFYCISSGGNSRTMTVL